MRLTFRKIAYCVLGVYCVITCYTGFLLLRRRTSPTSVEHQEQLLLNRIKSLSEIADDRDWNPWGEEFEEEGGAGVKHHQAPDFLLSPEGEGGVAGKRSPLVSSADSGNSSNSNGKNKYIYNNSNNGTLSNKELIVEVWGKAAIGLYLWQHIFNAELEERLGGVWSYGSTIIGAITFRFRTGPGVIPSKVPKDTENVLLILNGRESAKVEYARMWLDALSSLPRLRNAALVLLGNEQCQNGWLKSYLWGPGSRLRSVFLVYDSPWVDNVQFYQWPLGVATYRDFPRVDSGQLQVEQERPYSCNFVGTVYSGSSREALLAIFSTNASLQDLCIVKPRMEWQPQETAESRQQYLQAVQHSDLTLCPVGHNTESYRIYEALALGSVPVLEDIMTPGECGPSPSSQLYPLRLLKELQAPVIYVQNWQSLPDLLLRERGLSAEEKVWRRRRLLEWYQRFQGVMRDRLVRVLENRFFNINR